MVVKIILGELVKDVTCDNESNSRHATINVIGGAFPSIFKEGRRSPTYIHENHRNSSLFGSISEICKDY